MIRFFYAAVAALLLSIAIEHAFAVSLSPSYSDDASSPRFEGSARANVNRVPAAADASRADMSMRCKELAASVHAATASPERRVEVTTTTEDGKRVVNQAVRDKRADRESAYREYGCLQD
jgi:hypothetical protein